MKNQEQLRTLKKIVLINNQVIENDEEVLFQPETISVQAPSMLTTEEFHKAVEVRIKVKNIFNQIKQTNTEITTYSDLVKMIEFRKPTKMGFEKDKFGEKVLKLVQQDEGIYLNKEKISSDEYWELLYMSNKESDVESQQNDANNPEEDFGDLYDFSSSGSNEEILTSGETSTQTTNDKYDIYFGW